MMACRICGVEQVFVGTRKYEYSFSWIKFINSCAAKKSSLQNYQCLFNENYLKEKASLLRIYGYNFFN